MPILYDQYNYLLENVMPVSGRPTVFVVLFELERDIRILNAINPGCRAGVTYVAAST
jgi:hypothetical protein